MSSIRTVVAYQETTTKESPADLVASLGQLHLRTEAETKGQPAGSRKKLFDDFLGACRKGDDQSVREYLSRPQDRHYLLHEEHDTNGSTALIIAAGHENPIVLDLLLDHGADINYQNWGGDCALGEAAAFAQLRNVHLLLDKGANKNLKNNRGSVAADLANHPDRPWYHEYRAELKAKHPTLLKIDDLHRERIIQLLRPQEPASGSSTIPPTDIHSYFNDLLFDPKPNVCNVLKSQFTQRSVEDFRTFNWERTQWKTFATIIEPGLRVKHAMSGWSHGPGTTISGRDWTKNALSIAEGLNFTFAVDASKDQGISGQFQASHAEAQLMTYYLAEHHSHLPKNSPRNPRLGFKPFRVLILASRHLCTECVRFQKAVNEYSEKEYGFVFDLVARFRDPNSGTVKVARTFSEDKTAPEQKDSKHEREMMSLIEESRQALQQAEDRVANEALQKYVVKSLLQDAKELVQKKASGDISMSEITKSLSALSAMMVEIAETQKSLTALLDQKIKET